MRKIKTLGKAFPDHLTGGLSSGGRRGREDVKGWGWLARPHLPLETVVGWRVIFLGILSLVLGGLLLGRIFFLQIVWGQKSRELADSNRILRKVIHAPRGVIYDRAGRVLAESNPGFRLEGKSISREEALSLESSADPKVKELEVDTIRFYPSGELAAHIIGYVGEVSEAEFNRGEFKMGDKIGREGIEQIFEAILKGIDGAEVVEVDASGKNLRSLRNVAALPGRNVYLTVDIGLQKKLFEVLKQQVEKVGSCCGAAVAQDPNSGEILALVSYPSYDPNIFTDPSKSFQVQEFFSHPFSPLLNRVIAGLYPPGSTFKISTALAGLSSLKITKDTQIEDTGIIYLGPYSFTNWYFTQYGGKEGWVDLVKALRRSNDIFFYRVGQMVGEKVLAETAKKIGVGRSLGIDLPGEVEGVIGSDEWKREKFDQPWYPGDTLHLAIGQGFLQVTPLQILAQTSFVASGGRLYKPFLVSRVTNPKGGVVKQFSPQVLGENLFPPEYVRLVKEGLSQVPKPGGTAWPFFDFSISTAGKTGTAEFGDSKNRTHAWYTSYAPADDPKIALTVLVEGGGEGSSVAAPVAKEVYSWYFNLDKK